MSDLVFLRPLWLLALLPLGLLLAFGRRRGGLGAWSSVISPEMAVVLQRLGWLQIGAGRTLRLWLGATALLLILALSGPALPRGGQGEYRRLDPLLLALDLSPSVVASPVALAGLKASALHLLRSAEGRPVGLMAYAADAYLISPPTSDAQSLEGTIAVLAPETLPVVGSRPDIALSMARELFGLTSGEGPGLGGADLVVISDGAGLGARALEEARRLASAGARVWALALSEAAEAAPPPDHAAMQALGNAGAGGQFTEAEVAALAQEIKAKARIRLARDPQSAAQLQDFGPWLLLLAALAALPLYRRREG